MILISPSTLQWNTTTAGKHSFLCLSTLHYKTLITSFNWTECVTENSWQDSALQVEKIVWKWVGVFCFNEQRDSNVCKATQIRKLYMLQNLLEWAFNRCGCNFKVLISSCIHPFICCDTQARYLKTGRISILARIKTCNQVLHKTDWKRTKFTGLFLN